MPKFMMIAGLLFTVMVAGCSQSASQHGESIEVAYGWELEQIERAPVITPSYSAADDSSLVQGAREQEQMTDANIQVMESQSDQKEDQTIQHTGKPTSSQAQDQAADFMESSNADDLHAVNTDSDNSNQVDRNLEDSNPANTNSNNGSQNNVNQTDSSSAGSDQGSEKSVPAAGPMIVRGNPADEPKSSKTPPEDNTLTFGELYGSVGVRGLVLSDKVNELTGYEVEMKGYMAPPLTAEVDFFVLTKIPLAVCPFCSSDADWPTDIVVVYMPDGENIRPTNYPVKVTGELSTGSYTDEETGFVSLIRIYADDVEVLDN